jgi:hypothetical protein
MYTFGAPSCPHPSFPPRIYSSNSNIFMEVFHRIIPSPRDAVCVTYRKLQCYRWSIVSCSPNLHDGLSPVVGCQWLIVQHTHDCPSYIKAVFSVCYQRRRVTMCTASLTFSKSTFCPHSVFMCFVWISEHTAIISLYSINWLVFITEAEWVHCTVRTEFLDTV